MPEHDVVKRSESSGPVTVTSMVTELRALGLREGDTVIVHSSLSSLGWVCGGSAAVILALEQILTEEGTLVMPAHSTDLTNPAVWEDPPVPESWWEAIRREMPAFDPDLTPTRGIGSIPETFRKQRGVVRSSHPADSFAAWGKEKALVTDDHSLNEGLGESSPLARVYDLDGSVLLLGVDHGNNTSLHLAEVRATYRGKSREAQGSPIVRDGKRIWVEWESTCGDGSDFAETGDLFEQTDPGSVHRGKIGLAEAALIRQRPLVDFAAAHFTRTR